jgi:hypothetical protein
MSLLGVALPALLGGCAADLPDGVFDCSDGRGCPDGWRCLSDDRCYSPSFAGLDIYSPCLLDTDCASSLCLHPFETSEVGQCSVACSESSACPFRPGASAPDGLAGVCDVETGCIAACVDNDDCTGDQRCVVVPMTQGETACIDFPDASFDGAQPCAGPSACPRGLFCVLAPDLSAQGVCSWPCSPDGVCPTGGACETLPTSISSFGMNPRHACLATCNQTPGSCGTLTCAAFPGTDRRCVPAGWVP